MRARVAWLSWTGALGAACGVRAAAPPSAVIAPAGSSCADASPAASVAEGGATEASAQSCDAIADQVIARKVPLSDADRCRPSDIALAVLRADAHATHIGFVAKDGHGEGVVKDPAFDFLPSAHVSWRGTCLARFDETLAASDRVPPASCLEEATIRWQEEPDPLEETRAAFLGQNPSIVERWAACCKRGHAEACLDRLLPLSGAGSLEASLDAAWVAVRDAPPEPAREARCHLGFADEASGLLVFRCEGALVDTFCGAEPQATVFRYPGKEPGSAGDVWHARREAPGWVSSSAEPWEICGPDRRTLAVVAPTGPRASARCVEGARRALVAGGSAFAQRRVEALEACARDQDPDEGPAIEDGSPVLEDEALAPESRALVHRVLARQRELFGSLRLPPPCRAVGAGCVAGTEPDLLGRNLAKGCGAQVWAVTEQSSSGLSDGLWGTPEGSVLTRVTAGAPFHRPDASMTWHDRYAPAFAIGNTFRAGDVFRKSGDLRRGRPRRERDVIADACKARDPSSWDECDAYAAGGSPAWQSDPAARKRVVEQVNADWPRASRRLARWQRELDRGLRLDPMNGEERRQICEPLLVDACTGDIAEVCAVLDIDDGGLCDGRRLPDGRCEGFRFARLPIEAAVAKPVP